MPGLPMDQSDVVFKTQSSIELDPSAFLPSYVSICLSSLGRRSRSPPSGMGGGRRFSVGGGAPEISMGSTEGRGGETEGNGD